MKMTTEEAFVKVLQMHGIEHAFGIIGSAMMPISDLFPAAGIKFWDCAHECTAGMIADGAPAGLRGDPVRVRQILLNLLGNAIKFTDSGRVIAVVALSGDMNARGELRISVSDTGIGMSAEAMSRLFNPFVQADSSTTRRFGGTGLGLAIIKKLCDQMGGRIDVDSRLGRGSTFTAVLPVHRLHHVESCVLQREGDHLAHRGRIVHYKNACAHAAFSTVLASVAFD